MPLKRAYVMINTNLGTEAPLRGELEKVEGVIGVYQVYGIYDMVVVLENETEEELKDLIFSRIRTLKYIKSTLTLNVAS